MDIVPNDTNGQVSTWLALLPEEPREDEFGRPWALHKRRGLTPAQELYYRRKKWRADNPPIREESAAQGEEISAGQLTQGQATPDIGEATREESKMHTLTFRNGVLTDTHLYVCLENGKPARRVIVPPANIGEVFQLALTYHLAAIWIYPGTNISAQAGEAFNVAPEWELTRPTYGETKNHPTMFIGGYKKRDLRAQGESGETVYVSYPEHNSAWGLTKRNETGAWVSRLSSPGALLFTLAYVEDALGFPIQYSPGACGRRVITETNKTRERAAWIAQVDMRKFPICCAENVKDLSWKRALTPEESAQEWLLAYDKNSQYASACTGARLGSGEPEEISAPIEFSTEKLVAGVWHCKISGEIPFDGLGLPHPTDGKTEGYFWTYTVKLLIELGYTVEIDHAFIWRESHTILRPFAELLWKARAALGFRERYTVDEARAAAQGLVKDMMNHSIGTLNSRKFLKDGGKWFRPDWRELLRDNAKYQMFRRILKNYEDGYRLLGAHVDCLFYASQEKDHTLALPNWLGRKGLGGYKPKYSADIPMDVAREWFNDPALSIETINSSLDAYCLEQATKE